MAMQHIDIEDSKVYSLKKVDKVKNLSKKQRKKIKKVLKMAYIVGWVDSYTNIIRPDKQVDKILGYLYK